MHKKRQTHGSTGFRPTRYWPILLIATAVAESAHAPLMHGAFASISRIGSGSMPSAANAFNRQANKKSTDMHGPTRPDHPEVKADSPPLDGKTKKNPAKKDDFFPDLPKLILPTPVPTDPDSVLPTFPTITLYHSGGDVVLPTDNGGGGNVNWNDNVHPYNPPPAHDITLPSIDGGGGGGGGNAGGGSSHRSNTNDGGAIIPVPVIPVVAVAVPEPTVGVIFLAGISLLGRRRLR